MSGMRKHLEWNMAADYLRFSSHGSDDSDPDSNQGNPGQESRGDENLSADVGERYTVIGPELLVERGDE